MVDRLRGITLALVFSSLAACGGGGGSDVLNGSGDPSSSTTSNNTQATAQSGTVRLQWVAPVSRSDGTPLALSDITGYAVYLYSDPGKEPETIAVDDPTRTSLVIDKLAPGTYYLFMTTIDNNGLESPRSRLAVKEVT